MYPVFLKTSFTVAKGQKECMCLTVDKWINKMWSLSTVKYYPAFKRKGIQTLATMWMTLDIILRGRKLGTKQ